MDRRVRYLLELLLMYMHPRSMVPVFLAFGTAFSSG